MSSTRTIALFGGAFNPPHNGHISPLIALAEQVGLDEIRLLPSPAPPHKKIVGATYDERTEMLRIACRSHPTLVVDEVELSLPTPTYTVQTLRYFRQRYPNESLCFIIGYDSFLQLEHWCEWEQLLKLSHIIVLPRTTVNGDISKTLLDWQRQNQSDDVSRLIKTSHGTLFFAETPLWDVSSTQIRQCLQNKHQQSALLELFDPAVLNYILQRGLYV